MVGMKDRAKEYLAEHSKYSKVFDQTLLTVSTMTAMVEFAEQETEKLKDKVEMYDFFYEGNGFKRRGLNTAIQIGEYINKLEKENTELKGSNKMLEQGYVWHDYDTGEDCYEDTHEGKWVKRDEVYQLTKAKEIIRKLLVFIPNKNEFYQQASDDIRLTAERFLNSEVDIGV